MAKDGTVSRPISRRSLLIGGGVGVGLLVGWELWPRHYSPNLNTAKGEHAFNAFLKIGEDGHVTVIVPQAEMGQGVYTSLPQILADELGADWRTVAVEPSQINPIYSNDFIMAQGAEAYPHFIQGVADWALRQVAIRSNLMLTGGSTSIRGFEQRFREAGAMARVLLCMAGGKHMDAAWDACDTAEGFVVHGAERMRFAELAAEAATMKPHLPLVLRKPGAGEISGKSMPRIDLPAKVDGSARYATDVRLPDLVYAAIRNAPPGDSHIVSINRSATERQIGVLAIFQNPKWVATVATNAWAAQRALDRLEPQFTKSSQAPNDTAIAQTFAEALKSGSGKVFVEQGDAGTLLEAPDAVHADYSVPYAPHAAMEPLNATARFSGDRLEIWMPTQAPALARAAVARAVGIDESLITLYPMLVGGGFGRNVANDAAEVVAILAQKMKRPVQLIWSRAEETMHDWFRPAVHAKLSAKLGEGGIPLAWRAVIAAPSTMAETFKRIMPSFPGNPSKSEEAAIEGAKPPYSIPAISIEHRAVEAGVPTGMWRSVGNSYTTFFTETFIDELAQRSGVEPLSFRMQILGSSPRLARCLTTVTALGGWQGGVAGSGQGIAAQICFGSHIAMLVEAHGGDGGTVKVDRVIAAIDCGRVINPEIVRQQIEGGIIWGLSAALGEPIKVANGSVTASNFDGLGLQRLADTPEIRVEILPSEGAPGGVGEVGVATVAPALANALFAATGQRLRSLPLRLGGAAA